MAFNGRFFVKDDIKNKALTVIAGALCGAANGFFGGGGGMIAVPLMIGLMKMKTKIAHATAILVILPITLVSAIIYVAKGNLDLSLLPSVGIGSVVGGLFGAKLLGKLKVKAVKIIFFLLMIAAGARLLLL